MKGVFSPRASRDLEAIADSIAADNLDRAMSFIDELRERCRLIASRPKAFPERDDLAKGLRMGVHGNYLILFTIKPRRVRIERIVHGARNLISMFQNQDS